MYWSPTLQRPHLSRPHLIIALEGSDDLRGSEAEPLELLQGELDHDRGGRSSRPRLITQALAEVAPSPEGARRRPVQDASALSTVTCPCAGRRHARGGGPLLVLVPEHEQVGAATLIGNTCVAELSPILGW